MITNPNDLYSVGTFAHIHRFMRNNNNYSSDLHVHPTFTNDTTTNTANTSNTNCSIVEPPSHTNLHHGDEDESALDHMNPTASLLIMAHRRIQLESLDQVGPSIDVTVSHWDRLRYTTGVYSKIDDTILSLSNEILSTIREVAQINELFREHMSFFPSRVDSNVHPLAPCV